MPRPCTQPATPTTRVRRCAARGLSRRCRRSCSASRSFVLEHPHDMALGTVARLAEARRRAAVGAGALRQRAAATAASATCSACSAAGWSSAPTTYRERIERASKRSAPGTSARGPAACCASSSATASPSSSSCSSSVVARRPRGGGRSCSRGARTIHVLAQRRVVPGGLLPGLCARPARAARAAARRRRRHAARAGAPDRPEGRAAGGVSFKNYSPEVIEIAQDCHARERAGDRDHRQRALAAGARLARLLRDRGRRPRRRSARWWRRCASRRRWWWQQLASSSSARRPRERRHGAPVRRDLHRPRRRRPVRRADRRAPGGRAPASPSTSAARPANTGGRRAPPRPARRRCSRASATSTTAASCARRSPPKAWT